MSSPAQEMEMEIKRNEDLVKALGKDGLQPFLTKHQFDLSLYTQNQLGILAFFGADEGTIATVEGEKGNFARNLKMYQYIGCKNDPRTLIQALVKTQNSTSLTTIREALIPAVKLQNPNKRPVDSTDSATTTNQQQEQPSSSGFSGDGCTSSKQGSEQPNSYDCKNIRVLFINQRFDTGKKSKNPDYVKKCRLGAKQDGSAVSNLFEKTLKMKLEVEENVEFADFGVILKRFKAKCIDDENDGCIVMISTHGSHPDSLLMDDLARINIETDVIQQFGLEHFEDFVGKPKIFLFNACRSEPRISPDEGEEPIQVAYSDIFIVHSTLPLFKSYRWEDAGSCYIQHLCDVFTKNLDKHNELEYLLDEVGRKVAEEMKLAHLDQVPEIRKRLFAKKFYIKPQ